MTWTKTHHVPEATRRRVLTRDRHTCRACHGARCANRHLEVDHIIPWAFGGTDDDANLQTLGAHPCHAEKTAREAAEGRARRNPRRPAPPHPSVAT